MTMTRLISSLIIRERIEIEGDIKVETKEEIEEAETEEKEMTLSKDLEEVEMETEKAVVKIEEDLNREALVVVIKVVLERLEE